MENNLPGKSSGSGTSRTTGPWRCCAAHTIWFRTQHRRWIHTSGYESTHYFQSWCSGFLKEAHQGIRHQPALKMWFFSFWYRRAYCSFQWCGARCNNRERGCISQSKPRVRVQRWIVLWSRHTRTTTSWESRTTGLSTARRLLPQYKGSACRACV